MPSNKNIVNSSPNSNSSNEEEKFVLRSFKVKPAGHGATRNTLVENDSLSSYSWPDETSRPNGARRQSGIQAPDGATRDENEKHNGLEKLSLANSKTRLGKGDTILEIDNVSDAGPPQPSYIAAYMRFMYWTCVSPFNPIKDFCSGDAESWIDTMLNAFQKICFVIITTISMAQSFFEIKYNLLYNLANTSLEDFTDMCFYIMNGATKVYYVYLFLLQQKRFWRMFSSFAKLRAFRMKSQTGNKKEVAPMNYAILIGISSLIVSLFHIIGFSGLIGWTPEKAILYHSKILATNLFTWTTDNLEDETWQSALDDKYAKHLTTTSFLLGALQMIMYFCSNMQMDAVTNLMLANAETLKQEMGVLEEKINNLDNDIENISLAEFLDGDGHWAHLKLIRPFIKDNNAAMDALMKYKHVNNLMMFVYLVMNAFDGNFPLTLVIRLFYNIIETSYTYRVATQASSLNESKRKWVVRLAWKSSDKLFQEKVPLILNELEKEPIGMGKGQFMIDESFLYRVRLLALWDPSSCFKHSPGKEVTSDETKVKANTKNFCNSRFTENTSRS